MEKIIKQNLCELIKNYFNNNMGEFNDYFINVLNFSPKMLSAFFAQYKNKNKLFYYDSENCIIYFYYKKAYYELDWTGEF